MDKMHPFHMIADFEPKPAATPYDPAPEAELSAMSIAMRRFRHRYFHSMVTVTDGEQATELELAFEVMYVLNQLPSWLGRLAEDTEASLIFGAQGTERELVARRRGGEIVYWFRDFFTTGDDSPRARVQADEFLREWRRVARKVMQLMAELYPEVEEEPEFRELRGMIQVTA